MPTTSPTTELSHHCRDCDYWGSAVEYFCPNADCGRPLWAAWRCKCRRTVPLAQRICPACRRVCPPNPPLVSCETFYRDRDRVLKAQIEAMQSASADEARWPKKFAAMVAQLPPSSAQELRNRIGKRTEPTVEEFAEAFKETLANVPRQAVARIVALIREELPDYTTPAKTARTGRPAKRDLRSVRLETRLTDDEQGQLLEAMEAEGKASGEWWPTTAKFIRAIILEASETEAARLDRLLAESPGWRPKGENELDPRHHRWEVRLSPAEAKRVEDAAHRHGIPVRRFMRLAVQWYTARVLRRAQG